MKKLYRAVFLCGVSFFLFLQPKTIVHLKKLVEKKKTDQKKKIISYSACDANGVPLDSKLASLMNVKKGTFIEVGANDGVSVSNTKMLEESYGWKGILIEPSAILYPKLKANRPHSRCFSCALGSFSEHNSYLSGDFDGNLMASISGERREQEAQQKVLVRSLQSILDECHVQHVNFFSLDTEGYELNILQGIDFSRTTFDYFLIEVYDHQYDEIVSFLDQKGYEMVENFSKYSKETNPYWDGTHNDYLFKNKKYANSKH